MIFVLFVLPAFHDCEEDDDGDNNDNDNRMIVGKRYYAY